MSDRTRLDEIMDSMVPAHEGAEFRAWLLAGLERAFRHGVEQELAREHVGHPYTKAEPAPAEETCPRCRNPEDWFAPHVGCPGSVAPPGHDRGCVLPPGHKYVCREERRERNRRCDPNGRPGPKQGVHSHLWRDGAGCRFCGAPDRRSGSDRRRVRYFCGRAEAHGGTP